MTICPQCLVHAPGGIRCPDCAQLRRPPMYELETMHYVRAGIVAIVGAAAMGVIGGLLFPPRSFGGVLLLGVAGAAAATALGRALDYATNRKRGRALQLIASASIVGAAAIRLLVSGELDLVARDASGAVFVVIGVLVAWNRLA